MSVMAKPTEVSSKAQWRRFSTSEKLRVVREADACAGQKGAVAALLRREGLYSSRLRAGGDSVTPGSWARRRGSGARCLVHPIPETSRPPSSSAASAAPRRELTAPSAWSSRKKKRLGVVGG